MMTKHSSQPIAQPNTWVSSLLQGGGRSFEDLRELKNDEGLMKLIGYSV